MSGRVDASPRSARPYRVGSPLLSHVRMLSLAGVLTAALAPSAAAQGAVPFPRLADAVTDAAALCAAAPPISAPRGRVTATAGRDSAAAAALADSAAVATLAGEPEQARDLLRQASVLDAASPELAFRLGRVAEDLGDADLATAAYCRLRLASADSTQRADASSRVEALAVDRGLLPPEPALGRFERGVADAAAGVLPSAERAFDEAITRAPTFAIAYYDRALVRLALGRADDAAEDLRQFAALMPSAVGPAMSEARDVLARGRRSPAAALAWGIVPGGAQVYGGRPWLGAVVAAAAASGVVLALQKETRMEERSFVDPFGQPYTDVVPVTVYPRRTLGIAIAGGSTAAGAVGGLLTVSADRAAVRRLVSRVRAAIRQPTAPGVDGGR